MATLTYKDIENAIEYLKTHNLTITKIPSNEVEEKILREFDRFDESIYIVTKPIDKDIFIKR